MDATPEPAASTLNARVSAVALVAGAVMLFGLDLASPPLTPLRVLTTGVLTFGAWAYCDEMGMRKPLNRGGLVAFSGAMVARLVALIDNHGDAVGRYWLTYAYGLLLAMLLWSVAWLHRQRDLKVAGAVGVVASLAPILALLAGHIAVGTGAFLGVGSLMRASEGGVLQDFYAIHLLDGLFGAWAFSSAWFLWRGEIRAEG